MLNDLRALSKVKAPQGFVERVLDELQLGDFYAIAESAIGPVFVAWNTRGVRSVVRARDVGAFEKGHRERYGATPRLAESMPEWIDAAVVGGLSRKARRFDFATLSPFERDVLMKTREIPRGQVRPYSWVAREIGRPKAVRAVGSALAKNPVPLVIPCHRVVRADGIIGNYALGGSTNKHRLLTAEGVDLDALPQLTAAWIK